MPPSYPDISTIIHEKLEKNMFIPLSVTIMLDTEIWETMYLHTYSTKETLFAKPLQEKNDFKTIIANSLIILVSVFL